MNQGGKREGAGRKPRSGRNDQGSLQPHTHGDETMTTEQLNAVAELIGTDNKELVFATCIRFLIEQGLPAIEAVDAVLGSGQFDAISKTVIAGINYSTEFWKKV